MVYTLQLTGRNCQTRSQRKICLYATYKKANFKYKNAYRLKVKAWDRRIKELNYQLKLPIKESYTYGLY